MPGDSGVTVVTMLVCFFILHARLRAHRAPGIPCALWFQKANFLGKTRTHRAAGMRTHIFQRHCERSEAIQLPSFLREESWIASSQGLLAMTLIGGLKFESVSREKALSARLGMTKGFPIRSRTGWPL
jgi:hypothetical protein